MADRYRGAVICPVVGEDGLVAGGVMALNGWTEENQETQEKG